ncbi:MAG TPA: protein kinase [Terracidiphilus sp.]
MPLEQGQRVGDYEVLSLLGAGGMGRVYRVRNIISDRAEAMKILLPDYASEPELAARFMAEIRTLAALDHPNIAQLRTAFQFENQLVMVMEFVEGATLDAVARQSPAAVDKLVEYATQVLSALSYAHSHGVTHRDIKPANIMITSHGLAKLMDFGIAKSAGDLQLTRPGTTMGSVYYMSPEQVRGGTVDARSDIYSFGVTLYEMLTGRKPFQADTSYSVLNAQLNETPTPPVQLNPALPQALNEIILKAMAKAPADRFQSADEMRNAIKAVLQQPSQAASAPSATAALAGSAPLPAPDPAWQPLAGTPPPPPARKSHRGLWIALGAVAALIALVAAAALLPHVLSTHAGQKAEQAAAVSQPSPAMQPATVQAPATDQTAAAPAPVAAEQTQPAAPTPEPVTTPQRAPFTPANHARPQLAAPRNEAQQPAATQPSPAAAQPAAAAGPSPKEMQEAHDHLDNLGARADAARTAVESIRRQQQAQGLDLRGDILASMSRLNNDMNSANQALNRNDPSSASQYMDRAERELNTLETFLGH